MSEHLDALFPAAALSALGSLAGSHLAHSPEAHRTTNMFLESAGTGGGEGEGYMGAAARGSRHSSTQHKPKAFVTSRTSRERVSAT